MAGKRVIHVWREHLAGSSRWTKLSAAEQGAYLVSLVMLTDTSPTAAIRGCLAVGDSPCTFEGWWLDVRIRRRVDALRVWEKLHAVGLFEWVWLNHGGSERWYTRVSNFGINQDRIAKKKRPAPGTIYPVAQGGIPPKPDAEILQRSNKDLTKILQRSNTEPTRNPQPNATTKGLTTRKGGSITKDTDKSVITNVDRRSDPLVSPSLFNEPPGKLRAPREPASAGSIADDLMANTDLMTNTAERLMDSVPMPQRLELLNREDLAAFIASLEREKAKGLRMWRSRLERCEAVDPELTFVRKVLIKTYRAMAPGDDEPPLRSPMQYVNHAIMGWLEKNTAHKTEERNDERERTARPASSEAG